ncbi:family 16 glycosylhydrolase [Planctomycetales bacterium ZRK34]|nr:family 16 glycosylhydrolase [Planctomycetales bacterium ZRK34]
MSTITIKSQCAMMTLVAMCLALGACTTTPKPTASVEGRWVLQQAFSDEFDGPSLDLEKWDNDVRDWGDWSWEPDNVQVAGGHLHLRMAYEPHKRNQRDIYYTSGIIRSRAEPIRYGYFEARLKGATRFPGVCPAFWTWRNEGDRWTEIDFIELTQWKTNPSIMHVNTHVFKHPKLPADKAPLREGHHWTAPWNPRDDFHVYGCLWTPTKITWHIDGEVVRERENTYWDQPLDVALSFGVRAPLRRNASPEGFPTEYEVDYIRVWQRADADE